VLAGRCSGGGLCGKRKGSLPDMGWQLCGENLISARTQVVTEHDGGVLAVSTPDRLAAPPSGLQGDQIMADDVRLEDEFTGSRARGRLRLGDIVACGAE
jgi:hypothetical protein